MRNLKILAMSLGATVLLGAAFVAAPASATLCPTAPESHVCSAPLGVGTQFKATSTEVVYQLNFMVAICSSEMTGEVVYSSGTKSSIKLNKLTYENCENGQGTVFNPGSLLIDWSEGTHNGTVRFVGQQVEFTAFGVKNCWYYGKDFTKGVLKGGGPATLEFNEAPVAKGGGGFLCAGPTAPMSGTYTVETPNPLFVEQA